MEAYECTGGLAIYFDPEYIRLGELDKEPRYDLASG